MTFSGMKNALICFCIFHEKWGTKWSQNRCQNRLVMILGGPRAARDPLWMFSGWKKTEKGACRKWCWNFNLKKSAKNQKKTIIDRLRTIPGSFLEWSGGKGGRYWIDAGWLHRSPTRFAPRRGAADENRPKMALEPTLGHWLSIFWSFGAMQKKTQFVDTFLEAQKSEKLDRGAANTAFWGHGPGPRIGFLRILVPGAASRATWY